MNLYQCKRLPLGFLFILLSTLLINDSPVTNKTFANYDNASSTWAAMHVPRISNQVYLPLVLSPETHFYALALKKNGTFYGVWVLIRTAIPAIREPVFSYASINITGPTGQWVETGWTRASTSEGGCVPKFTWAIQPGYANFIDNPRPTVGVVCNYLIYRKNSNYWHLTIFEENGTVLVDIDILNPGFDYGDQMMALGEVYSPNKVNDMGVSSLRWLYWYDQNQSFWIPWNGWQEGIVDPPYVVVGLDPDMSNNVQVYGNNGNPIPPDAPCP